MRIPRSRIPPSDVREAAARLTARRDHRALPAGPPAESVGEIAADQAAPGPPPDAGARRLGRRRRTALRQDSAAIARYIRDLRGGLGIT